MKQKTYKAWICRGGIDEHEHATHCGCQEQEIHGFIGTFILISEKEVEKRSPQIKRLTIEDHPQDAGWSIFTVVE